MSDHGPTRLETELELLEAMYPNQTHYGPKSRELKFSHDNHASLLLRLPESYPELGLPDIISATDAAKNDLRTRVKVAVKDVGLAEGEEVLDAIVAAFQQVRKNWQAFQVRYEEEELWHFAHGTGVKEMESMSEVVKGVETEGSIGKTQKEELLEGYWY
ncbi:unnamed protein product [Alternaria alternata]